MPQPTSQSTSLRWLHMTIAASLPASTATRQEAWHERRDQRRSGNQAESKGHSGAASQPLNVARRGSNKLRTKGAGAREERWCLTHPVQSLRLHKQLGLHTDTPATNQTGHTASHTQGRLPSVLVQGHPNFQATSTKPTCTTRTKQSHFAS